MSHMPPDPWQPLHEHGVLLLEGGDASAFLHGQVTADVASLAPGQATLAALCTPQGRVIAIVRIGRLARGLAVVLPRELAATVASHLRRYVLRAKVSVHDASAELAAAGLAGTGHAPALPAAGWESLQLGDARRLAVGPATALRAGPATDAGSECWDALCVASGEPEVYRATSEAWVPQMLNLDLLGAVSLTKGCYTGQEIVARLQYRGQVKRRLFRYRYAGGRLAAGAALCRNGTEVGTVVRLAGGPDAGELLAVVGVESGALSLSDADGRVTCAPLPLPYPVPGVADRG